MDILKSLMGNKSLLTGLLGQLKNAFLKDGVSAIFITTSDDPDSETPGMSIRKFSEPVAILAGEELAEVQEYFRLKEASYTTDHFYFGIDKKLHQVPEPGPSLSADAWEEVQEYFKVKGMHSTLPGYFLFLDGRLTYLPNSIEAREQHEAFKEAALREPKEVDNV